MTQVAGKERETDNATEPNYVILIKLASLPGKRMR